MSHLTTLLPPPEATRTEKPSLFWEEPDGRARTASWAEFRDAVARAAAWLRASGLNEGDLVVISLPNHPLWDVLALATNACGAGTVGISPSESAAEWERLCGMLRPKAIIVEDGAAWAGLPKTITAQAVGFSVLPAENASLLPLPDFLAARGVPPPLPVGNPLHLAWVNLTSGSTGASKAVAISHVQAMAAVEAICEALPWSPAERTVCWLPIGNPFQRIINLVALRARAEIHYLRDPRDIFGAVKSVRPTIFIGVPRFFEKFYTEWNSRIDRLPRGVRAVIHWALRRQPYDGTRGDWLAHVAKRLLLRPLAGRFGELTIAVSGSAPCPRPILEFFLRLGVPLREAYGCSECLVPIAINTLREARIGTVGKVLPQIEARVASDGEIWIRSAGLSPGYLDGRTLPRDADGFYATGDLGVIDPDGFLRLQGRKGQAFKTSTGKWVEPTPIELLAREETVIEHALVVGRSRPFPVALVTLRDRAREIGEDHLHAILTRRWQVLPVAQRPAAVRILPTTFTLEGGELTANGKLRRNAIEEKYRAFIDDTYHALETRRKHNG